MCKKYSGVRIENPTGLALQWWRRRIALDRVGRAVVVEPVRIWYLWRPFLADAHDDLVLETAVSGRTGILVTFNRRHVEAAAVSFGLEILTPADAVRRLEIRS